MIRKRLVFLFLSFVLLLQCSGCIKINHYDSSHVFRVSDDSILLSFDDGPTKNTAIILDILKQYDVKAAFFLTGENAKKYPELVEQIANEGHYIGNHTFTHARLTTISFEEAKEEILQTQAVLGAHGTRKWFRPTFGELPYELSNWLVDQSFTIVRWSAVKYTELKPGDILLLHETDNVVKTLPKIISQMNQILGKIE